METKPDDTTKPQNDAKLPVMQWVAVSERLPAIDESDNWNKEHKISKDVLTYSKEWGMRFGRYFYGSEFWTINGVSSSNGVKVDYWMPLPEPPIDYQNKMEQ